MVPISLLVTIEITSSIQSWFLSLDNLSSVDAGTKLCDVHCTRLNEELGQVSYVFSDKTGTLTCNEMIFKKAIVDGVAYGDKLDIQCTAGLLKVGNVDFHDPDFFKKLVDQKIR